MMNSAIYIDDTGTPDKSKSKYDSGNWETWVAIILNPNDREKLLDELTLEQSKLKSKFNANEFHFTEIFSGKKQFKNVSLIDRIEIFKLFANIYKKYNSPIFVQSLTDDDVIRNKMEDFRLLKIDGFDFKKNEHFALWLLLMRIIKHEILLNYSKPIDIFVDAGKQKPNTSQTIKSIKNVATNSEIKYVDSKKDPLMQFIDFIAFCLNRCRWILMNNKKSESDLFILQLAHEANFNTINIVKKITDVKNINTIKEYDDILRSTYNQNENLSDEEMEKIKNNNNRD